MDVKENVKAVYTESDLAGLEVPELRSILEAKEIEYHPRHNENSLIDLILDANGVEPKSEEKTPVEDKDSEEEKGEIPGPGKEDESENNRYDHLFKDENVLEESVKKKVQAKEGIVVLELIDAKKTGSIRVRNYTDSNKEERILRDRHGKQVMRTITRNTKLNMADEDDRLFLEHIKDHPVYANGSDACFRIIDTEQEAQDDIDRTELAIKAKGIIMEMSDNERRSFARVLGINTGSNVTNRVIKQNLYMRAEHNPEELLSEYTNPDRDLISLAYRAIDKGVITKDTGVYKIKDLALGMDIDQIILYLKENIDLVPGLRRSVA